MNHLVVLRSNLPYLGKRLNRHIALQIACLLMCGHRFQQLNQLGARAMLSDIQPLALGLSGHSHGPEPVDAAQQNPGHTKGPDCGHQHALQLCYKLLPAAQTRADQ